MLNKESKDPLPFVLNSVTDPILKQIQDKVYDVVGELLFNKLAYYKSIVDEKDKMKEMAELSEYL